MNAGMPTRSDRIERVARAMLALALLAGVIWALAGAGAVPTLSFHDLLA